MKKLLISTAVLALLLGACSQTEIHFADPADVAAVSSAQNTESPDEAAEPAISEVETAESSPTEAAAYEADAEALPLNAPAEAVQEKNEAPPAARKPRRNPWNPRPRLPNPMSACLTAVSRLTLPPTPKRGGRSTAAIPPTGPCRRTSTRSGPPVGWRR